VKDEKSWRFAWGVGGILTMKGAKDTKRGYFRVSRQPSPRLWLAQQGAEVFESGEILGKLKDVVLNFNS